MYENPGGATALSLPASAADAHAYTYTYPKQQINYKEDIMKNTFHNSFWQLQ